MLCVCSYFPSVVSLWLCCGEVYFTTPSLPPLIGRSAKGFVWIWPCGADPPLERSSMHHPGEHSGWKVDHALECPQLMKNQSAPLVRFWFLHLRLWVFFQPPPREFTLHSVHLSSALMSVFCSAELNPPAAQAGCEFLHCAHFPFPVGLQNDWRRQLHPSSFEKPPRKPFRQ